MLLTQCLGDREGTALIAWNPVSIPGRVLSWQRPICLSSPLDWVTFSGQQYGSYRCEGSPSLLFSLKKTRILGWYRLPVLCLHRWPAYFSPFSGVLGLEHRNTDLLQDLVSSSWNLCSIWKFRGSSHYVGGNLWLVKMITYRVIQNSCLLCGSE